MDFNETFNTNDVAACSGTIHTAAPIESAKPESVINNTHKLGRDVALAMACMEAAERLRDMKASKSEKSDKRVHEYDFPAESHSIAIPTLSIQELSIKLRKISAEIDTQRAELIWLLVQFDDQQGWDASGARNCADWANANLGLAKSSVYEYLRVGRELQELPIINSLFRGGALSWSKTKSLTRVADATNERELADVALVATVSDVERICREFRWAKIEAEVGDTETGRTAADLRAERQFKNRSFNWQEQSDGSVQIRLTLPLEKAQVILRSLDFCDNELYGPESDNVESDNLDSDNVESTTVNDTPTATQRRADAMVLMAERSLEYAGTDVSRSDRYQVILHVENRELVKSCSSAMHTTPESDNLYPSKRPWIEGAGPIASSVASRITCDASIVTVLTQDGEPLNVGRKTRVWPTGMRRAIVARDRHCQFPDCSEHRYLDVHHIKHWANGGETSVDNGICLCPRHHTLVHEGGYTIERNTVTTNAQPGSKDFGTTIGLVSRVKKALLPTRYRFRFIKPVAGTNSKHGEFVGVVPEAKSTGCDNNRCNELHADYYVSRRGEKNEWVDFTMCGVREKQPVYH